VFPIFFNNVCFESNILYFIFHKNTKNNFLFFFFNVLLLLSFSLPRLHFIVLASSLSLLLSYFRPHCYSLTLALSFLLTSLTFARIFSFYATFFIILQLENCKKELKMFFNCKVTNSNFACISLLIEYVEYRENKDIFIIFNLYYRD